MAASKRPAKARQPEAEPGVPAEFPAYGLVTKSGSVWLMTNSKQLAMGLRILMSADVYALDSGRNRTHIWSESVGYWVALNTPNGKG